MAKTAKVRLAEIKTTMKENSLVVGYDQVFNRLHREVPDKIQEHIAGLLHIGRRKGTTADTRKFIRAMVFIEAALDKKSDEATGKLLAQKVTIVKNRHLAVENFTALLDRYHQIIMDNQGNQHDVKTDLVVDADGYKYWAKQQELGESCGPAAMSYILLGWGKDLKPGVVPERARHSDFETQMRTLFGSVPFQTTGSNLPLVVAALRKESMFTEPHVQVEQWLDVLKNPTPDAFVLLGNASIEQPLLLSCGWYPNGDSTQPRAGGHWFVAYGYDQRKTQYKILDPCFGGTTIQAGTLKYHPAQNKMGCLELIVQFKLQSEAKKLDYRYEGTKIT